METIVKFHENPTFKFKCPKCGKIASHHRMCCDGQMEKYWEKNRIISRTLRKIGVVPSTSEVQPQAGEFWRVRITQEVAPGQVKGCFVLELISKLNSEPGLLVPGFYSEQLVGDPMPVLVVTPTKPGDWILPVDHKRMFSAQRNVSAVIINLGGTATWDVA